MLTLIYFILILGIIVLVHEFGHFIFSKLFGVHVFEFSIGMGPRLFGTKKVKGKTQYNVRALPIGGYVALAGEDPTEKDPEVPEGGYLYQKPVWQRFIIMCAGVFNNFLLAIILLFLVGIFHGAIDLDPVVDKLEVGDPMYEAGIREGDIFKSINGHKTSNMDDVRLFLMIENDGTETEFVMERDGKKLTFNVKPKEIVLINELDKESTLYKSGIREGDRIKTINGENIIGQKNFEKTISDLKDSENIEFVVEREGEDKTLNVSKIEKLNKESYTKSNLYGITFETKIVKGLGNTLKYTFVQFGSYFKQIIITFEYLFQGKVGLNDLSGPVGIYSIVGQAAQSSALFSLTTLTALLCVNVGFINILPFPAFDGGRVLFLIIEKIKGSPVNPKIENAVNNIGFMLLMVLVLLVTISDILKLF